MQMNIRQDTGLYYCTTMVGLCCMIACLPHMITCTVEGISCSSEENTHVKVGGGGTKQEL